MADDQPIDEADTGNLPRISSLTTSDILQHQPQGTHVPTEDAEEKNELLMYERHRKFFKQAKLDGINNWYKANLENAPLDIQRDMNLFIACYSSDLGVESECDGCNEKIKGHRYRCLNCVDMDLCDICYRRGTKPKDHSEHHDVIHLRITCDNCNSFIVETRIHCNECPDFDLCLGCYRSGQYPECHNKTHSVTKSHLKPGDAPADMLQTVLQLMTVNNEHEFNTLRQKMHQLASNMARALNPNAGEEQVELAANLGLSFLDATINQKAPVEKIIDAVGSHIEQLTGSDEPESENLWFVINDEVYENTERYLHYTNTNSTHPAASREPSNTNNSEEQNSTQLNSVLDDVIVNIVLQSLANCVRTIVCLFEFGVKWSGIFLPVHTTDSSRVLMIVKIKNTYTATTDINEIRKFAPFQEITFLESPLQVQGEKTIDDALELLQHSYTKFFNLATAQKFALESKCAKENELDGYKLVLTGSAKEKYHAMAASDEDYLVEINKTVFNDDDFIFSYTKDLHAHLTLKLDCDKRKAFEQKHSEMKNFLTKLDGEENRWFLNARLLKKAFENDVVSGKAVSRLKQFLGEMMLPEQELTSPAVTVADSQGNHEVDLVVSLRFSGWPSIAEHWRNRERQFDFPSKHVMDDIISGGFYVVPKASVNLESAIEQEWRLSFSIPECKLIDSFDENQSLVYYVMKSIHSFFFKTYNFNVMISSYHIKTTMFWMCELWSIEQWKDHKRSIAMMFELLSQSFSRKLLPHYFIPTHNLIYKLDDAQCNAFKVSLAVMSTQLGKILRFYIINGSGIGLFPRSLQWQFNMLERIAKEKAMSTTKSDGGRKEEATSMTKTDDGRKEKATSTKKSDDERQEEATSTTSDDGRKKEATSTTKSGNWDVHAVNSLRDYGDEIVRDMQSTSGAKMFIARVIGPSIHSELLPKRISPRMSAIPVEMVNSVVLFTTRFLEAFYELPSDYRLRFHVFFTGLEEIPRISKVREIEEHYENSMQAIVRGRNAMFNYLASECHTCTHSNATVTTMANVKFIYERFGEMGESLDKLVSLYRDTMGDVTFTSFAIVYFRLLTKEIMHRLLPEEEEKQD